MRRTPSCRGLRRIDHHSLTITPGPVLTPALRDILGILAPPGAGLSSPAPENYQTLYATYRQSVRG